MIEFINKRNQRIKNYLDEKKEINKLLKDKKFKKLAEEFKKKIKCHAKDINKQQKQFDKTFEKIVKTRKKFEKQLVQLKK